MSSAGWMSLRVLPRPIWVLCATTLVNRLGTMALPFLVLYLTGPLQFSPSRAGQVMAVFGVSALVGAWGAGRLADRVGPLPVLRGSLLVSGLLLCAYPLAHRFELVVLATILWAVSAEAFRPAVLTVIAIEAPGELRKPAYALNRLAVNLGMSVGPALGGLLLAISFPLIFIVDGLSSVAAAVWLWLAFPAGAPPPAAGPDARAEPHEAQPVRAPSGSTLPLVLVSGFLTAASFFQFQTVLGLFLTEELALPAFSLGLIFTLNTVLILLFEVPFNAATAGWSHRRTLASGALLMGVGFGAYALSDVGVPAIPVLALATTVWTIGEMLMFPRVPALLAEIAPSGREGRVMSSYVMAWGVAFIVAPWSGLEIYQRWGHIAVWVSIAGWCAIAALGASRIKE